ncbi:MAG: hypothetical protein FI736_06525 [SAR202 cluster bacterium]|nr:hypothetical protein [SAR202 cluster bacterium]|tara:strand:+ start:3252 stop:3980 length:729 start_codon:yes stop_codon:yes gene_type:complete
MIDINNKKFNFYDPVTIVDNDKEYQIFSETLYILSEKYIPSRENKMIMNQFENLVINHNNTEEKQKTSEKIYTGFEYLISTDLIKKLDENQNELSLLSSNFILLDINHNHNYNLVSDALEQILDFRMIPIISHPERFEILNKERIFELKDKGILFQLSLGSFSSFFGEEIEKKSKDFLEIGIYDFIATDSINYYQMNNSFIENKIESVSKIIGSQKLNEIFLENPKNVTDQKSSNDFQISRH